MRDTIYFRQADLLVQVLPFVHAETCFALKGGTAINFFVRDFPRLSVDIDLVYLPVEDRPTTLKGIDAALQRIASRIRRALPGSHVGEQRSATDKMVIKLGVRGRDGAGIKIEPNTVLRGTLHPVRDQVLAPKAATEFGRSVVIRVVSLPDLYGGKLCAALDRQHPRDLFDVHGLLRNEGLTDEIRQSFIVYLASHDRAMADLLKPSLKDLRQVYAEQFSGMTNDRISLADLVDVRARLIDIINAGMTGNEREFLLSMKRLEPKWDLLPIPGLDRLPGPQWKLYNLRKMDPGKRASAERRLRELLGL